MEYHVQVLKLHEFLLGILAAVLSDEEGILDDFKRDPAANIKLLHYPSNIGINDNQEVSLAGMSVFASFSAFRKLTMGSKPAFIRILVVPLFLSNSLINIAFRFYIRQQTHGFLCRQERIPP
jgi:hypothetical protein